MKSTRLAPMLLLLVLGAALLAFLPFISDATDHAQSAQRQPTAGLTPDWAALLQSSTLVVRGQVVATQSRWDAGHTRIESQNTVAVRYVLLGEAPAVLLVQTVGGVLADGGLGMFESGLPSLATNEEVLLFLTPVPGGYGIAGDNAGKYTVEAGMLVNRRTLFSGEMGTAYAAMAAADRRVSLPAGWADREAAVQPEAVVGGLDFVYNNMKWFTNTVEYRANNNSAHGGSANGSSEEFLQAIQRAADTWTEVGEADFRFVYAGATTSIDVGFNNTNEVVFIDKGLTDANGRSMPLAVARVFYIESDRRIVEADIWVNDAYDWDATGAPTGMEPDLQSVLIHEFGHWLALGHDTDSRSIMYPSIMLGTTKWPLFDNDRRGISFIYPCPSGQQPCNPIQTSTITPTPTPTLTPTPSPTAPPQPASRTFAPHAGGMLTYTTAAGTAISLTVPAEAVAVTTTLIIEHTELEGSPPLAEQREVECFAVKRLEDEGPDVASNAAWFTVPLTLSVAYSETAIAGLDEATLALYVYDAAAEAWVGAACAPPTYDEAANRIEASICGPDTFGLFAARLPALYLPAIVRE